MAIHRVDVEGLSLPDGIYYALPMRILELISEPWRNLMDSSQIVREQEISEAAMKLDCVGFRSEIYINHPFLNENASRDR